MAATRVDNLCWRYPHTLAVANFSVPLAHRWVPGLLAVSAIRTCIGLLPATIVALLLYRHDLFAPGPVMVLFFLNLLVTGWRLALGITAIALCGAALRPARNRDILISIGA